MSVELAPEISGAPARRWKPYSAYKDSDAEWLGEMLEHWDARFTDFILKKSCYSRELKDIYCITYNTHW